MKLCGRRHGSKKSGQAMRLRVKDVCVFAFASIFCCMLFNGAYHLIRQNQRVIQRHDDRARALEARLASALEAEIELLSEKRN